MLFVSSCVGKSEPKTTNDIEASKTVVVNESLDKIYYFSDALTYELKQNGETSEIWFYVNPKTKQILYLPNDDMIKGVISFPDGSYKIFGSTEFKRDTILNEVVPEVLNDDDFSGVAKLITSTIVIDQKNIQQKNINCQGYRIDYEQMEGGENIYVTTEIPINSRQIYGFCRLNGDARVNPSLDYLNVLNKSQTITHIEAKGFSMKLLNYGPNPYWFTVGQK